MPAALIAISDKGLGRKYVVAGQAIVGRHPECEIQIVDSQASKQHARLVEAEGVFSVEDLGSLNGVYVNGSRIEAAVRLQPNDLLAIGDHAFVFDPDLDILPDNAGENALVMTAEGRTETAGTIRRPVTGTTGDPFVGGVLSLLAAGPEAGAILPQVFDRLAEELPFDAAAVLAVTGDGVDNAFVRSSKRTVSIPRTIAAVAVEERQAVLIPDAAGDTSFSHGKSVVSENVRSVLLAPLLAGDACVGAVYLTRDVAAAYREQDLDRLLALTPVLALALQHSRRIEDLERTIVRRSEPARVPISESSIRGSSATIEAVRAMLAKAAPAPSPVLILGETGSGKELIARELHRLGGRPRGPFIPINCGAIPEHLVESEFFGHERGAFSGAERQKPGTLELASGGTLFLDEIGELSPALQVKLLRALEEKSFYRVGGVKPVKVDFRLVAATHRDLKQMIQDGTFREDLYFRLNVLSIRNPPLRERPEDVAELAAFFLTQLSAELGKPFDGIDDDALDRLRRHAWPGNIRELKNIIERVVVLGDGPLMDASDLPPDLTGGAGRVALPAASGTLPEQVAGLERERITEALRTARGKKVQAAKALGISRPTLDKKIKDYGIDIFGEGS